MGVALGPVSIQSSVLSVGALGVTERVAACQISLSGALDTSALHTTTSPAQPTTRLFALRSRVPNRSHADKFLQRFSEAGIMWNGLVTHAC